MGERDELRIALVMNGGVSLAVWIGGVTAEFGRLIAAERQYGELLSLLRWEPRIDVIAGSSAGGVNGAYLALALKRHSGRELTRRLTEDLRNVWIIDGAINELLRDPTEPSATSLLDGDGYYYEHLRDAFSSLNGGTSLTGPIVPIDLVLTATLLNGQPDNLADDFGSPIPDISHRARLHFRCTETNGQIQDDFNDDLIADRLAVAARSTSSFPAAFEPSFCPIRSGADDGQKHSSGLPFMDGIASFPESRFLIDGGVLDNKPLDVALDCIFRKPASSPARRVLAYVVPDPGTTEPASPDNPATVPTVLPVIFDSTLVIPSVQSIANDIGRLREHNDRVRRRRRGRTLVTRHSTPAEVDIMANILFPSYRDMRLAMAFDEIVEALNVGFSKIDYPTLGKGGRKEWLRSHISSLVDAIPWVPNLAPLDPEGASERGTEDWAWGTRTLIYLSQLNRDLLVRMQRCRCSQTGSGGTGDLWQRAFKLIEDVQRVRAIDTGFWMRDKVLADVKKELDAGSTSALETADQKWLLSLLKEWRSGQQADAGRLAQDMAGFVLELNKYFHGMAEPAFLDERVEYSDLQSLLNYFVQEAENLPEVVLQRLLSFMVVDQTLGSEEELREQAVDFIQVSGNDDLLTGRIRTAAEKLNGIQLGHFGAFYKHSWRANDWLWGRRDAVPRILRVLLDPSRLVWIANEISQTDPAGALLARFRSLIFSFGEGDEAKQFYADLWKSEEAAIAAELRYVGEATPVIPERLTTLIRTMSHAFDVDILRVELPRLAAQIVNDRDDQMATSGVARGIANAMQGLPAGLLVPAETADSLSRGSLLGDETWKKEIGTDPATFTASKVLAVAVTTLRTENGGAASLGKAVAVLRIPTLIAYGISNSLLIGSRTAAAIFAALTAAAAAIILTWFVMAQAEYPEFVLIPAWSVLVVAVAIALLRAFGRGRWWWLALPVTFAVSLPAALYFGRSHAPLHISWTKIATTEGALLLVLVLSKLISVGRAQSKRRLR